MTDIAIRLEATAADEPAAVASLFPRRLLAVLRLVGVRRRHSALSAQLDFADEHMAEDLGVRRSRHRHDWLEAFLTR